MGKLQTASHEDDGGMPGPPKAAPWVPAESTTRINDGRPLGPTSIGLFPEKGRLRDETTALTAPSLSERMSMTLEFG